MFILKGCKFVFQYFSHVLLNTNNLVSQILVFIKKTNVFIGKSKFLSLINKKISTVSVNQICCSKLAAT